ncbi:hypothetical protein CDD80_363 [Ophiocordyceps camponoti-rufipedis]|uniref:Extracellular membrane protein CFEM domain-containing protein n=1 Tax=Ophiocordyceps camponoti-rufipedis TaxID=2004952 RepID=A0A2C5ZLG5_9HYPO|nr:hypothetical protein CDD80_363 [Ophiocordyceps camponoti-rufipedis]
MKFFATLAMAASVVLAAQEAGKAGKMVAGGYGGGEGYQGNDKGPVPEAVKNAERAIAAYQTCFNQRMWNDIKHYSCEGSKKKSDQAITDCICKNKEKWTQQTRANSNICIGKGQKFAGVVREFAADVSGLTIEVLCEAGEEVDNMMYGGSKVY